MQLWEASWCWPPAEPRVQVLSYASHHLFLEAWWMLPDQGGIIWEILPSSSVWVIETSKSIYFDSFAQPTFMYLGQSPKPRAWFVLPDQCTAGFLSPKCSSEALHGWFPLLPQLKCHHSSIAPLKISITIITSNHCLYLLLTGLSLSSPLNCKLH